MSTRIKNLRSILSSKNEAIIIASPVNRQYFTGFASSAGTLIVTADDAIFIIDSRYYEMAERACKNINLLKENEVFKQIDEFLCKHDIKSIMLETNICVSHFNGISDALPNFKVTASKELNEKIVDLRSVKDEAEITNIKAAQAVTDAAFSHMLTVLKPGMSEIEVMLELEFFMRKNGATALAFETIAVSGSNSSLPHGVPSEKKIENGDFLTMDFGAMVNGYCSDMTRTVAIGHASDEMKSIYNTVLIAQTNAINAVKAGVTYKSIDFVARDVITKAGYGDYFEHGTGHSLGLEIHEPPNFNKKCDIMTKTRVVMTVEPGIYLPGKFGVRIEDMVLITDTGCEVLTNSNKELIII